MTYTDGKVTAVSVLLFRRDSEDRWLEMIGRTSEIR